MRIGLANLRRCLLLLMAVPFCQAQAQQWNLTSAPVNQWGSIACSADATRVVAVANNGPMYVSTNGGVDWNPVVISGTPWVTNWTSIASSADGRKLVATTSDYPQAGLIHFSTDSGVSWAPANAPPAVWSAVAISADGSRCFAGIEAYPGGPIYASTNSGADWFLTGAPTNSEQWSAIASSADGTVVIASSLIGNRADGRGSVYTSSNAGTTWQTSTWQTSNVPALAWASVAASADGRQLIAAPLADYFMGFILAQYPVQMSSDFGSTWSAVPSSANPWNGVASSAEGLRWTAVNNDDSGNGGFCQWTNGYGQVWYSTNTSGELLRCVACSADGARAFAAGSHIYAFSTAPVPPLLSLNVTGQEAVVSWIVPSTPYVLEESANLNGQWTEIVGTPALNGIRNEVSLPSSGNAAFYRLRGTLATSPLGSERLIFSTAR